MDQVTPWGHVVGADGAECRERPRRGWGDVWDSEAVPRTAGGPTPPSALGGPVTILTGTEEHSGASVVTSCESSTQLRAQTRAAHRTKAARPQAARGRWPITTRDGAFPQRDASCPGRPPLINFCNVLEFTAHVAAGAACLRSVCGGGEFQARARGGVTARGGMTAQARLAPTPSRRARPERLPKFACEMLTDGARFNLART